MSVGRICNRVVVLAGPHETAKIAAKRMLEHRVGTLLVLNDLRQPIGILTDRDLVTRVMAIGKDPEKVDVSDVMTRNPTTISEDTPLETTVSLMRSGGFRRMPVVSDGERLVGIVSLDDVLSMLAEEFTKIGDLVSVPPHR